MILDFTFCRVIIIGGEMQMKRLRELRRSKKINMKELGKIIGVSEGAVSLYENGKRKPDYETLTALADYFGVSTDYLLERTDTPHTAPENDGGKRLIPVLGRVQAGVPIEAVEEVLDWEELDGAFSKEDDYFGLRIRGDSMEPRICEGDVVIVRCQNYAESGDIVIALINGNDATIKKIKYRSDGILLIPFNTNYEPMFYSKKEVERLPVLIIGRVVELRGKF